MIYIPHRIVSVKQINECLGSIFSIISFKISSEYNNISYFTCYISNVQCDINIIRFDEETLGSYSERFKRC